MIERNSWIHRRHQFYSSLKSTFWIEVILIQFLLKLRNLLMCHIKISINLFYQCLPDLTLFRKPPIFSLIVGEGKGF